MYLAFVETKNNKINLVGKYANFQFKDFVFLSHSDAKSSMSFDLWSMD